MASTTVRKNQKNLRKMTLTDKEKLRMAKNLVKSNNKKIKKALELLDELSVLTGQDMHLLKEIKEILEK